MSDSPTKEREKEVRAVSYLTACLGLTEFSALNEITGDFEPASFGGVDGRYPTINQTLIDTTAEAAVAGWEAIQTIIETVPEIDSGLDNPKVFNLATESYGGHYGPAFSVRFQLF